MDLSVIIPCYNLEKFITPLLNSLKAQKFNAQIELIFVLDSCTDNTRQVIEDTCLESYGYTVKILTAEVHSCGLARNVGMEASTGSHLQFVDGDDWLNTEDAFMSILNFFEETKAPYIKFKFASNTFPTEENWPMVWQFAFTRQSISKLRFKKVEPNEDNIFMYCLRNIYLKGFKPPLLEKRLYFYNYGREGSNMSKFFENLREKGANVTDIIGNNLPGTSAR